MTAQTTDQTADRSLRGRSAPPTESPSPARPFDPETHVRCFDYIRHQHHHRRLGEGWICDICQPPETRP